MKRSELLAYCAGYIDGDGCISAVCQNQSRGHGVFVRPYIAAGGKNTKPLDRLVGLLGGDWEEYKPGNFLFTVSYRQAISATGMLRPFLMMKRNLADLMISWGAYSNAEKIQVMHRLQAMNHDPALRLPNEPLPRLPKRELNAYLAGLTDADGYIDIGQRALRKCSLLAIESADRPALDMLKRELGGSVVKTRKTKIGTQMHRWDVTHRKAKSALRASLPYLTFKRPQADRVLLYQNSIELWTRRLGAMNQFNVPEEVRTQWRKWEAEIKAMHYRRPADAETKPEQPRDEASDSPDRSDGKATEIGGNDRSQENAA